MSAKTQVHERVRHSHGSHHHILRTTMYGADGEISEQHITMFTADLDADPAATIDSRKRADSIWGYK